MFGLFKSVTKLVADVAEVAMTPVEIAVDVVDAALQPVVEVAKDLKNDVKSLKD